MDGSTILTIDLASPVPAYEQIAGGLRSLLLAQKLNAGEALPPVRQLAGDLGVHFNTVAQAYRILAEEGWLDLRQGRGATVISRQAPAAKSDARRAVSSDLDRLIASALSRGVGPAEIRQEVERLLKKFTPQRP